MSSRLILLSLCGVLWATPPAGAQERATVAKLAVLDLADKGVGTDIVSLMSATVARQLSSYGVFEVITRADVGKMLTHVEDKISAGCTTADCLVQVGDALGAEKLVGGEVGMVGKRYLVSLQRINMKTAVVEQRVQREFEGPVEKIREEVRLATHQLVEDILKLESGTVLLQVSEEGADVAVDGSVVGTSPIKGLGLPAGPHELRVVKQGFVAWARTVQVRPRSTEALEARLIPSAGFIQAYEDKAFSMRRWAWVTFAAFAVLEGAALGLRVYTWQKYDPIEADYKDLVDPAERYQYYQDHVDEMRLAEKLDYAALGSALVGVVVGGGEPVPVPRGRGPRPLRALPRGVRAGGLLRRARGRDRAFTGRRQHQPGLVVLGTRVRFPAREVSCPVAWSDTGLGRSREPLGRSPRGGVLPPGQAPEVARGVEGGER